MRKKTYTEPQIEVTNIKMNGSLLIVSGDTENYNINDDEVDAGNAL
jgi:hypothetical protein